MKNLKLALIAVVLICINACDPDESISVCNIYDLETSIGDCNDDGTYSVTINFLYDDPSNNYFDLYIRDNVILGTYTLSDLPLTIDTFTLSGNDEDFIKVCINDNPDCCEAIEFVPPNCEIEAQECDVRDITVALGECNEDGTYSLTLDFIYENPGNEYFEVYVRNNVLLGYYLLTDLPLQIDSFALSGNDEDFIKVCINDNPDCCEVIEFVPPQCFDIAGECEVRDITVDIGDCNEDGTYSFTLDFIYETPANDYFDLYIGNNVLFGYYLLDDLPIQIDSFAPRPNNEYDFIKVCINDMPDCCMEFEFMQPDC